jgi:excinuclease ABC subunit C
MREVVQRHYENILEEDEANLPDLVLIDGGQGQLSAAVSALNDLGLENQIVASIAKKEEIIFVKGRESQPIALPKDSPVLHLIQMMRDEAHRFAVTYHRKRRELRDFNSELMDIPGIGEVRKKVLLRAFGSLERVKQASFDELSPYVGPKVASQILEYFNNKNIL